MHRSKTAELVFKDQFDVRSAGLYGGRLLERADMQWADIIAVMDNEQRNELVNRFPFDCLQKRLINLEIPDYFYFNQKELIDLLKSKKDMLNI